MPDDAASPEHPPAPRSPVATGPLEVTSNLDSIDLRRFRRRFAYVANRVLCDGTGWEIVVRE
jgi:hypothetical protein